MVKDTICVSNDRLTGGELLGSDCLGAGQSAERFTTWKYLLHNQKMYREALFSVKGNAWF